MAEAADQADERARARRWVICVAFSCGVLLIPAPLVLMAFGMAIGDALTDSRRAAATILFIAYPTILVATPLLAWGLFRAHRYRAIPWVTVLPLLWIAYLFTFDLVTPWFVQDGP